MTVNRTWVQRNLGFDPLKTRLKIDPDFDPLRGNPRFQKLVAGG